MDKVKLDSSYIPPNVAAMINEWDKGAVIGEPTGVTAMDPVMKWMRGFISAFYGWSNDGKGTFTDFMAVVKAKRDNWKFLLWKQEDMNSYKTGNDIRITANDIYNGLVWTYTGITPYKHFSEKYKIPKLSVDEYQAAIEWVSEHFFVMHPEDRRYKNVFDDVLRLYEHFGFDAFFGDPFKAFILDNDERGDYMLTKVFIAAKELALKTHTSINFVSHAKSMNDEKNKDGSYKIVNQFMQLGGSAWDINMDSQYTIYRPDRHLNPNDPKVLFRNLKQRKAEIVGANRGDCSGIKFDFLKRRFYFSDVCPIDGSLSKEAQVKATSGELKFPSVADAPPHKVLSDDDLPF